MPRLVLMLGLCYIVEAQSKWKREDIHVKIQTWSGDTRIDVYCVVF